MHHWEGHRGVISCDLGPCTDSRQRSPSPWILFRVSEDTLRVTYLLLLHSFRSSVVVQFSSFVYFIMFSEKIKDNVIRFIHETIGMTVETTEKVTLCMPCALYQKYMTPPLQVFFVSRQRGFLEALRVFLGRTAGNLRWFGFQFFCRAFLLPIFGKGESLSSNTLVFSITEKARER